MKRFLARQPRTVGKAKGKRRYDLPLNRGAGTGFLLLLIGLMTFLAVLALSASFALSAMTARWSSGLENRLTVEVPATDENGATMTHDAVRTLTDRIARSLETDAGVESLHVLSDGEITDLVRPWLGDDLMIQNVPVPGLITLSLKPGSENRTKHIEDRIQSVAPQASPDNHEEWLRDLLRFTRALQFAAALLALVIGVTTAVAVAGAVHSRLAVHAEEVKLLHLMGAADRYIARQFQRHALILALQGALGGLVAGGLALLLIGWSAGEMDVNLLPDFHIQAQHAAALCLLPFAVGMIAVLSAGRTVYRVLGRLP